MENLPDKKKLIEYLKKFRQSSVLVVGDIMFDHFIWGKVTRISPEAPVPVVDISGESMMLGGAANVLGNVKSLGGGARICGVVGNDDTGRRIVEELRELKADTGGIVVDELRPTTIKTRVIAHSQQVVRFDREDRRPISRGMENFIIDYAAKHDGDTGAIIVSDYSKGVVSRRLVRELVKVAARKKVPLVVDPKVNNFECYKGATVVTPNNLEASQASGIEIADDESLLAAGSVLLKKLEAKAVLITRGEHGMSIFEKGRKPVHIPTVAKEVYDVTGAGDTVIAVFSLALAAGAEIREAAVLANHAAGIVVGEIGTATVGVDELKSAIKGKL